jgi:release factor glutamine methyltransferase
VQHAFGLTREQLLLRPDQELDEVLLEPLLARRANREPLAYILGERGFYGLSFRVTPAVLIPRPETELLVEAALAVGQGHILDIGTGSGCIAVTLAKLLPEVHVWATDISETALEIARENAARHGAAVTFRLGDLLAPLPPEQRFEVIVSNPPYIAPADAAALQPEVGIFEPHTALFDPISGSDGLTLYRRLASDAPTRLNENGWLMVEVGMGQAEAVAQLFADAGLTAIEVCQDLAGIPRVVLAQKSGLDRT